MNNPNIANHLKSLALSFFGLIKSPESIPGYILETVSEWNRSRSWRWMWITVPFLLVNVGLWATAGFFAFRNTSSIVQAAMVQVSKKVPLEDLERIAFEKHYVRNRVKLQSEIDAADAANSDDAIGQRSRLVVDGEFAKSDRFLESEVLLSRAYRASPNSVQAQYQLALLLSLDTKLPSPQKAADELMQKLSENEADLYAPAHAWMATTIIGSEQQLKPTDVIQLEKHLKIASQWKQIEPALLSLYSRFCFDAGLPERALAVAKLAAESRPELNLQYAQLLKALGPQHDAEYKQAVKAAENAFEAKIAKPNKTEADRIGFAQVLLMQDQREKAVEILQQGLTNDPKSSKLVRRGLADLHIEKFRADNEVLIRAASAMRPDLELPDDGLGGTGDPGNDIDWTNLQAAAKFDRDNPTVGQEVAFQWRKLAMPPNDLLDVLRHQLREDLATTEARLMIAELYLIKGRVEDAKIQWQAILKNNPDAVPALNNLSVVLSRESPPKLSLAIELIERANRIKPFDAEICDTYGEVYMNAGRPIDAIGKLEESIRIDPKRIPTRKRLATCYREIGMNDMAGEQIVQIKRLEDERFKKANQVEASKATKEATEKKTDEEVKKTNETTKKTSDVPKSAPESSKKAPESSKKAPESSKKAPESSKKAPESSKKAPEPSNQSSKSKS